MAKTKASASPPDPVASPDIPAEMSKALLLAATDAMEAGAKVWCDWQEEMSRFVATRVEADLKFQQALVTCRDVGELAAIQQEWTAEAARNYLDEVTRLSRIPVMLPNEVAASRHSSSAV